MIPVRTRASNFVYRGPTPDVGDAWVQRKPARRAVYMTWRPSAQELEAIVGGALIELGIYGMEPIPPVSVNVSDYPEIGAIAAAVRDRAAAELQRTVPGAPFAGGPGYWAVSSDVWQALQDTGALDPADGAPTLLGRPLMKFESAQPDMLEYQPTGSAAPR